MKYLTSVEAAEKLGVTKRRINYMCQNGDIQGVIKDGNRWRIPEQALDIKVGTGNRPLPIGISDFKRAVSEYYYVDKTMLIAELLDYKPLVALFTRPRRFGKSLNIDMLKVFFEDTGEDTSEYFVGTRIWGKAKYRKEQGQYPVISLSFKDVKYDSWEETLSNLKFVIQSEYRRHIYLRESDKLAESDKVFFESVINGTLQDVLLPNTLAQLMLFLKLHHGKNVVVLIDEYDTPIQQGHVKGYYEQIIGFMRNFLSGGLKDNQDLERAFLTGILRVAKESIFSGLNNLNVNSILEDRYSSYFGFTETEVKKILHDYGMQEQFKVVKEWYDGYHFGNSDIYNPWSVLSFVDNNARIQAYWQSTGNNSIIGEIIENATDEIISSLYELLDDKSINTYIDTAVVYPEIQNNPSSVYSFLLMAGYLTIDKMEGLYDGNSYGTVHIPNKEVKTAYEKEIISKLEQLIPKGNAIALQQALISNDAKKLETELNRYLKETVSFYDTSTEGFYHGLMLGLIALLGNYYHIDSNREAGSGRYDIQLKPFDKKRTAYILELKAVKEREQLEEAAKSALKQIVEKEYYSQLKKDNYKCIVGYGLSFCMKECCIICDEVGVDL